MPDAVPKRPKVGVGVLIQQGDRVLVGRRGRTVGSGDFALPGGHLEYGESFEECAVREVAEETGLILRTPKLASVQNCVLKNGEHVVVIFMKGTVVQGDEARNLEPDKCDGWLWTRLDDIPEPRFLPLQQLLDTGFSL